MNKKLMSHGHVQSQAFRQNSSLGVAFTKPPKIILR
jgi:hypothetical protein